MIYLLIASSSGIPRPKEYSTSPVSSFNFVPVSASNSARIVPGDLENIGPSNPVPTPRCLSDSFGLSEVAGEFLYLYDTNT